LGGFRQFSVKIPLREETILLSLDQEIKRQKGKKNRAFIQKLHDNINMKKTILEQEKEIKSCMQYLEEHANGKTAELYKKATTFPFHEKCYDMIPVEGDPDARECLVNPRSLCPVNVPKDKKTGKYIVHDPRICGRCLALDCRKLALKPTQNTPKIEKNELPIKLICKRDHELITRGEKDCYNCKWLPTECNERRYALLRGS